ncbi:hypothetical protein D3C86_1842300 [compost metagenome]
MQHQHGVAAVLLDAGADRRDHRQPVGLAHVGAVDRWQQFAEDPGRQLPLLFLRLPGAQPRLEAGGGRQAVCTHLHADGAAGVEHQEFCYSHDGSPQRL